MNWDDYDPGLRVFAYAPMGHGTSIPTHYHAFGEIVLASELWDYKVALSNLKRGKLSPEVVRCVTNKVLKQKLVEAVCMRNICNTK
jgi:hypothetical protein